MLTGGKACRNLTVGSQTERALGLVVSKQNARLGLVVSKQNARLGLVFSKQNARMGLVVWSVRGGVVKKSKQNRPPPGQAVAYYCFEL